MEANPDLRAEHPLAEDFYVGHKNGLLDVFNQVEAALKQEISHGEASYWLNQLEQGIGEKTHENFYNQLLQAEIRRIENGGSYLASDWELMEEIAAECRLDGGIAVEMARAVVGLEIEDGDCIASERTNRTAHTLERAIEVAPNPSKGVSMVSVDAGFIGGRYTLYSLTGEVVFDQPITQQAFSIDLLNRASGMYILKCTSPTGSTTTIKIVKSN